MPEIHVVLLLVIGYIFLDRRPTVSSPPSWPFFFAYCAGAAFWLGRAPALMQAGQKPLLQVVVTYRVVHQLELGSHTARCRPRTVS